MVFNGKLGNCGVENFMICWMEKFWGVGLMVVVEVLEVFMGFLRIWGIVKEVLLSLGGFWGDEFL